MIPNFKKWLEDTGEVTQLSANTAVDDKFAYIRSKYMSGYKQDDNKKINVKKIFGKK